MNYLAVFAISAFMLLGMVLFTKAVELYKEPLSRRTWYVFLGTLSAAIFVWVLACSFTYVVFGPGTIPGNIIGK